MTAISSEPDVALLRESRRGWSALPLIGRAQPLHVLLTALLYAFFAVFLVWPVVQVVISGFARRDSAGVTTYTLAYVKLIFDDPTLRAGLINALVIAILVTLITLAVSLPLAILGVRYSFRGRGLLSGLLLVPLVLPPFVGALGVKQVLARFGPLTLFLQEVLGFFGEHNPLPKGIDWLGEPRFRILGIVIVETLHLYPVMVLNIQAALANIDPAMQQAAANIGASRWRIFRSITMPMVRPGLFAGCTLVMIWSFTELGTPLIFNFSDITPVQLFVGLMDANASPLPFALVIVMLLASTGLYVIGKVVLGRSLDVSTTKASMALTPTPLKRGKAVMAALPFVIVFVLAVLPHLAVILTSISGNGAWYRSFLPTQFTAGNYGHALVDELAFPSIRNSLLYASCAMLVAAIVGLCAAIVIVRSNVPGRGIIDALCMLPLAVPGLVLASGYLAISITLKRTHKGLPFWLDVQEFPVVILILAYAARRLPYVVRAAVAGLQQTPHDLELAGANLGASRFRVLRLITLPLIIANLIAGGLLAFAFAMLEVSDSLILSQRMAYYPITKAILDLSQRLGDGPYIACAMGVWAMVLLTLTILAANQMLGKKMGAVFRV